MFQFIETYCFPGLVVLYITASIRTWCARETGCSQSRLYIYMFVDYLWSLLWRSEQACVLLILVALPKAPHSIATVIRFQVCVWVGAGICLHLYLPIPFWNAPLMWSIWRSLILVWWMTCDLSVMRQKVTCWSRQKGCCCCMLPHPVLGTPLWCGAFGGHFFFLMDDLWSVCDETKGDVLK